MGSTKLAYPAGERGDGHRKEVGFLPLHEGCGHTGRKLPGGPYHTAVSDRKGKRRKVMDPDAHRAWGFGPGNVRVFPAGERFRKCSQLRG